MGKGRGKPVEGELVDAGELRERWAELPLEAALKGILSGKVLLLNTDSAYQARLVKKRIQRLMRKKGINANLVYTLVGTDGGWRYAIMLKETFESLLSEEEAAGEAPGGAIMG